MDSIVKKIKKQKHYWLFFINYKFKFGFILPFAVLISGILLSIGLAVFNIIIKEVILSSSGRESQFAFYAADTGGECAIFWDAKQGVFPTSSASAIYSGNLSCGGATFDLPSLVLLGSPYGISGNGSAATTTFRILSSNYCAKVTVGKSPNKTTIESEGYNTCNTADPRRVERAIRITY